MDGLASEFAETVPNRERLWLMGKGMLLHSIPRNHRESLLGAMILDANGAGSEEPRTQPQSLRVIRIAT
jgi:hypothetical protein